MKTRLLIGVVLMSFAVSACDEVSSSEPTTTSSSEEPATTAATDQLVGEWDTGEVSIDEVRQKLSSAGYTADEIEEFISQFGLEEAEALQFRIVFYREGGQPFVYQQAWDPATGGPPNDADHGPYELLPNNQVAITSADPDTNQYRFVYAYDVTDETLNLQQLVSSENPGVDEEQLRLEDGWLHAATAAPYQLLGPA